MYTSKMCLNIFLIFATRKQMTMFTAVNRINKNYSLLLSNIALHLNVLDIQSGLVQNKALVTIDHYYTIFKAQY